MLLYGAVWGGNWRIQATWVMRVLVAIFIVLAGMAWVNVWFNAISRIKNPNPDNSSSTVRLIADWYWMQGFDSWMNKNEAELIDNYSFATSMNPENLRYWTLASQTIGLDCFKWEWDKTDVRLRESVGFERQLRAEYGEKALLFFERSRSHFVDDPRWYMSAGYLAYNFFQDKSVARQYFAEAVLQKDAPYMASRMYLTILIQEENKDAAYSYLRKWYPSLPEEDDQARKPEMTELGKRLEEELGIMSEDRFFTDL